MPRGPRELVTDSEDQAPTCLHGNAVVKPPTRTNLAACLGPRQDGYPAAGAVRREARIEARVSFL